MNHQNRPGPLNEHDYYSTRENTETQQNENLSQEEVHIDGLQVILKCHLIIRVTILNRK
jgi:hypothetical protein